MKISRIFHVLGLLAGIVGLFAGLFLLDNQPLFGVLAILGAMAVVLKALTKLASVEARNDFTEQDTHLGEY